MIKIGDFFDLVQSHAFTTLAIGFPDVTISIGNNCFEILVKDGLECKKVFE